MTRFLTIELLCLCLLVDRCNPFSFQSPQSKKLQPSNDLGLVGSRRDALASMAGTIALVTTALPNQALAGPLIPDVSAITTVTLDSAETKIGVELYDVSIGSPPQIVPAVRAVRPEGAAALENVQPGMIILGNYKEASKSVVSRIKNGPYPLVLQFYDLGKVGDYKDNPIPAQDALVAAAKSSREASTVKEPELSSKGTGLVVKQAQKPTGPCTRDNRVRRGDTLEINFEARVASPGGPLYDSSQERGGPVSFVAGAGEVVNGIEIGIYDMCPGEIRTFDIPASLGYGRAGSEYFDIPGDVRLWWKVELLSVTKGKPKVPLQEMMNQLPATSSSSK